MVRYQEENCLIFWNAINPAFCGRKRRLVPFSHHLKSSQALNKQIRKAVGVRKPNNALSGTILERFWNQDAICK